MRIDLTLTSRGLTALSSMLGGDFLLGGLEVFRVVGPIAWVIAGLFKFGQLSLDLSTCDRCIGLLGSKRCDGSRQCQSRDHAING